MLKAQKDAGFSLVEMMMVVAIIGLMTSAVVLYMPSNDNSLKDTLVRTEGAFIAMSRHSVMTGRVYGARFRSDGFDPYVLTADGWALDAEFLKPEVTKWQPVFLSALNVAGADVDLAEETVGPHVWFLPTSETTGFELKLTAGDQAGTVEMDVTGKAKVTSDG